LECNNTEEMKEVNWGGGSSSKRRHKSLFVTKKSSEDKSFGAPDAHTGGKVGLLQRRE